MKKLYKGKAKKIHPSPTPSTADVLSGLPAAILILAAALSPAEKEVLAYLLSGGQQKVGGKKNNPTHPPQLGCGCFGCYKSFWARWDASPNRHLIHRILDAVEESVEAPSLPAGGCRRRFDRRKEEEFVAAEEDGKDEGVEEEDLGEVEEEEEEAAAAAGGGNATNPVRRFMSYIGERVWGVWN